MQAQIKLKKMSIVEADDIIFTWREGIQNKVAKDARGNSRVKSVRK